MTQTKKKQTIEKEPEETNKLFEQEIEKLKSECDSYKDKYIRTLADFDNFKKRNIQAKDEAYIDGVISSIKSILPSVDALEKAIPMAEGKMKEGLESVMNNILTSFKALGVEQIDALDKPFDPKLHNAIFTIENSEKSGIIINEVQKGYILGDKVIRYTVCAVGK